jgi:outer membrane immunogenic protein
MKSSVTLAALLLALPISIAAAADLPSKKEPVLAPVAGPVWTGVYAGLNAGYGFGTNSNTTTNLLSGGGWNEFSFGNPNQRPFVNNVPVVGGSLGAIRNTMTQSGFIGGAQFGYNYHWGQNFLIGFEADIQGTTTRGGSNASGPFGGASTATIYNVYADTWTGSQSGFGATNVTAGISYLGTARGRVGYLITPTLLTYGTGGLAYGGAWANVTNSSVANTVISYKTTIPNTLPYSDLPATQGFIGAGSANNLLVGYSAGGGLEWMFMPNWSLKGEVIYYNLGNMNVRTTSVAPSSMGPSTYATNGFSGPAVITSNTSVNYQGIIARAGVNYHFNFASMPVVAKF